MLKSARTWQTDLNSILKKKKGSLSPLTEDLPSEGLDYQMYLRILFMLTDQSILLERLQTLIELNMQKSGAKGFLLTEHLTDFELRTKVQGRTGQYGSRGSYGYN